MRSLPRILLTAFAAALVCAVLSALAYFILAALDGSGAGDAAAFSLVAGFAGFFAGGLIGLVVALIRAAPWLGAVTGLVATLGLMALYVFAFGQGRLAYFTRESLVVFVILGVPAALTGAFAGFVSRRLRRE